MPPTRRGPAPLTDDDVARLRADLAAGSEPRVQLLVGTPAAPAGTRGPVVAMRDPGTEPEFIVLRVAGDEVPFSPTELTWPVRGSRSGRGEDGASSGASSGAARGNDAARERGAPEAGTRDAGAADPGMRDAGAPEIGAPEAGAPEAGAPEIGAPGTGPPTPAPGAAGPPTDPEHRPRSPAPPATTGPAAQAGPGASAPPVDQGAPAARVRRPRPQSPGAPGAQPFTVTLRFTGTDWTAETTRGGRRGRPRPLPVAAVRGLAERLDDPDLRRALLGAVEACREQARLRAEQLRAELEQVETVLAQLEDEDQP